MRHTVEIVDLISVEVMSKESDYEKELEKIREEKRQISDDSPSDVPIYHKLSEDQKLLYGVGAFLLGGFIGAFVYSTNPLFGFFVFGLMASFSVSLIITEAGVALRRTMEDIDMDTNNSSDNQQQQQISTNQRSGPTTVCQNCGWQNPANNNYCHDCGNEIKSTSE